MTYSKINYSVHNKFYLFDDIIYNLGHFITQSENRVKKKI